jgi:helix-turn-helix protein
MTATEEPTLYDVLEVEPEASLDELRAAVDRARETYGSESLAVYALVSEGQLDELRAKLDEAAAVLLDPARRASYDRSIGRIGPATLWAEDEDDDEAPLPPVEPGPHARAAALELEPGADEVEVEVEEERAPRQHALALELSETPGPFGRATAETGTQAADAPAPAAAEPAEPLLSGDWAAAVPVEQPGARAASPGTGQRSPSPAGEAENLPLAESPSGPAHESPGPITAVEVAAAASSGGGLPPSLGLRAKTGASPPPEVAAPAAPPPPAAPATAAPELPVRHREGKVRLELPSDAEFNGELLRRVRESYGLSLQQVAERTRITRIHLENVEADRYDHLPATVYLRGILVNLARELRLDPARVSKTYLLAAQRSHGRAP